MSRVRANWIRWWKFNAVGGMGIVVQLVALALLKSGVHVNYLLATALAVEAAVIHNFFWHERYTWADRWSGQRLVRLAKFNLSTGVFSILGNLVAMRILAGELRVNYFVANLLSIATCSVLNFLAADRLVFLNRSVDRFARGAPEYTCLPGRPASSGPPEGRVWPD